MTNAETAFAPIKQGYRIQSLDVMRGIVLFGILLMNIIGMGLARAHNEPNVLSAQKSYRFYAIMLVVGYSIGLAVNYREVRLIIDSHFSLTGFSKSMLTYDLGRVPVAFGNIAFIILLCKAPVLNWLKRRLAAVGKMALTNYIMHSLIALFFFTGAGFGMFGKLHRHELLYVVFSIWIFQLIVSPIWLKYFEFGPMEWVWRMLSYQQKYPLRKKITKSLRPHLVTETY